jgi:hypothetical protein
MRKVSVNNEWLSPTDLRAHAAQLQLEREAAVSPQGIPLTPLDEALQILIAP